MSEKKNTRKSYLRSFVLLFGISVLLNCYTIFCFNAGKIVTIKYCEEIIISNTKEIIKSMILDQEIEEIKDQVFAAVLADRRVVQSLDAIEHTNDIVGADTSASVQVPAESVVRDDSRQKVGAQAQNSVLVSYVDFYACASRPCKAIKLITFESGDSLAKYSQKRGLRYVKGSDFEATKQCNGCDENSCDKLPIGHQAYICGWTNEQGASRPSARSRDAAVPALDSRSRSKLIEIVRHRGAPLSLFAFVEKYNDDRGAKVEDTAICNSVMVGSVVNDGQIIKLCGDPSAKMRVSSRGDQTRIIGINTHEGKERTIGQLTNLFNQTSSTEADPWATAQCFRQNPAYDEVFQISPESKIQAGTLVQFCNWKD